MLKNTVEFIVKSLVNQPENVVIESMDVDGKTTVSISVDQQDVGKMIGKDGRTIKALRMYVASLGSSERPVYLELKK